MGDDLVREDVEEHGCGSGRAIVGSVPSCVSMFCSLRVLLPEL